MAFNFELAQELLERRNLDTTPYFAGRHWAIRQFDAALGESERVGKQAVFRIYQGGPGCGKSSLVGRLRQIRSRGVLFVDAEKEHLASEEVLVERVRQTAVGAGPAGDEIASSLQRGIRQRRLVQPVGNAWGDAFVDKVVPKTKVVLHMDEAHLIGQTEQPGLLCLHAYGLGVPVVCLFTGLGHTADRIGGVAGLTRLASNAVVNLGAMSEDECLESTSMMLDELGVGGDKTAAARMVGALSNGWPQHLHCGQMALCRELLRTDGELGSVNDAAVRSESDRCSSAYYSRQFSGSVLAEWRDLTAGVVVRVQEERPRTLPTLTKLCRNEFERRRLDKHPDFAMTPKEFAATLVERGVLSLTSNRQYHVAIPSIERWLRGRARGTEPRDRSE
ncbi:MAG: hypothetical protein OXQ90_01085 [Gammaproteobacteria bacterium]|nr:hypothetical protein [Gammaproteobacteria bacterium]